MIDRRTALLALATVAVSPAALAKPLHPLPDGLTPEFLRELAEESRRAMSNERSRLANGIDHVQFTIERAYKNAEIFDRMAAQSEPFDGLDSEFWARDRALQIKHGYVPA